MFDEPDPARVNMLVDRIRPILAGHHPAMQGAVVADLLAIWLAGYPAEIREALIALHVETVRKLVPVNAAMKREATDA